MSRRHKENIKENQPKKTETQEDSLQKKKKSFIGLFESVIEVSQTKIRKSYEFQQKSVEKMGKSYSALVAVLDGVCNAIIEKKVVVDDKSIIISHKFFEQRDLRVLRDYISSPGKEKKNKRGRKPVQRLFRNIRDSKIVKYFKESLANVKSKCTELYDDMKQYCVCFFKGAFNTFAPDEEPYGKLSHFHRIIAGEIEETIPCRKTLSNAYKWLEEWKSSYIQTKKERIEQVKYNLWMRLIFYISDYLKKKAPQYACSGV